MRKPPPYELPLFSFDLYELNQWAAKQVDEHLSDDVIVTITDRRTLAAIYPHVSPPRIELHSIFNTQFLPVEVMQHVLIHEHIHRVIPPREVTPGEFTVHPPEFWEREQELVPYRRISWSWMYHHWRQAIWRDERNEWIRVYRDWRFRLFGKKPPLNDPNREFYDLMQKQPLLTWEEATRLSEPDEQWGELARARIKVIRRKDTKV